MTTKEKNEVLSLNDIVKFEIPPLLRRQHLNRDVVIGIIGDRGDGKSVGGSVLALLDYMLEGEPCWSNMSISCGFEIDAATAGKYGLDEGRAVFQSRELDKYKLLTFDPEYSKGAFFIDEINVWLADARRSMSNQNLYASDVSQELRKLESALIYTCITEMFVEQRIRDITDIFIRSQDTALSPEGLAQKRTPGVDFRWTIYPISRKLTGERYIDTRRTLPPVFLHARKFWGICDTLLRQQRRKFTVPIGESTADITIDESPVVAEHRHKWGWLDPIAQQLLKDPRKWVPASEIYNHPEVRTRGIAKPVISTKLNELYGIRAEFRMIDGIRMTVYVLPEEAAPTPTMLMT